MKNILEKSLQTAQSYTDYKKKVLELLKEGKSTGIDQNEDLFHFTKLNNQRMKRLDKQTKLNEETLSKTQKIDRDFIWLVLTESWCGDAAQTLPVINKFAEANEKIVLRVAGNAGGEVGINQIVHAAAHEHAIAGSELEAHLLLRRAKALPCARLFGRLLACRHFARSVAPVVRR